MAYVIFTRLNPTPFIILVPKINAATIHRQRLCPYFYDRLWAYLHATTIQGAAFNQVNTIDTR